MKEPKHKVDKQLSLGNFAIARGVYEAGCTVASAYPGTPSTEILEKLATYSEVNCEWSPNEKVALEVAIGSSIAGARSFSAMKHVGLNVAADPLFTASYTGVTGGLVVAVADDPSIHSSQNEQDSRYYALSTKIPMIEPSDSEECYVYAKYAFHLSEEYDTPILIRLTTRVSHSQGFITHSERKDYTVTPYKKNAPKYVMMPANARDRHKYVEDRMSKLAADCNSIAINRVEYNDNSIGIVTAGGVYNYVKEAMPQASVLKLGMIYPLPIEMIREFATKVSRLIVVEELDGFIQNQLLANGIVCEGKNIFSSRNELNSRIISDSLMGTASKIELANVPARPPVLCAGCPHRSVYYVINKLKLNVMGDIGCYTLGALPPLSAVDAVVCMGASIGMAIGAEKAQGKSFAKKTLAVIGDSTFIHSGITGLIDAVYNNMNTKIVIVDNSTTGMTGHQNHPATGKTITGSDAPILDLTKIITACGVKNVVTVNAIDPLALEKTIKSQMNLDGVSVIIAKYPCALLSKTKPTPVAITAACKNCKKCLSLGCPAILSTDSKPVINSVQCNGCGVCAKICPFDAIK